jgi:hypothetical protein
MSRTKYSWIDDSRNTLARLSLVFGSVWAGEPSDYNDFPWCFAANTKQYSDALKFTLKIAQGLQREDEP